MNDDEELTDEQVDELLENIGKLIGNIKRKAEAAKNKKKSLPDWLNNLLVKNKPSKN